MTFYLAHRSRALSFRLALAIAFAGSAAYAAPCADLTINHERAIYGAGGSAVTPTLRNVAAALQSLPPAERVQIFYNDPGACTGYGYYRTPDPLTEVSFKFWNAAGDESTCEATQDVISFAHMGNTPALCPGDVPLPSGSARFVAPVQTINVITHWDSQQRSISAEALYHIFGFGPGTTGRSVAPWSVPEAVFVRQPNSFVHQIIAGSTNVPAANFELPPANFLNSNGAVRSAVFEWGEETDPQQPLGYVSGSNAADGEDAQQVRTLAYQHFGQSCAYLPDTSIALRDKINVRSGQYWLWTPAWFYAYVDSEGNPENELVGDLIRWFDGSQDAPGDIPIQEIVVDSGDIPLCAMQAIRPNGDLSAIQSYAPERPCNGWFEFIATGSTDYQACSETSECAGADDGEECRFGFCELY